MKGEVITLLRKDRAGQACGILGASLPTFGGTEHDQAPGFDTTPGRGVATQGTADL
jgi:hypothetical protein